MKAFRVLANQPLIPSLLVTWHGIAKWNHSLSKCFYNHGLRLDVNGKVGGRINGCHKTGDGSCVVPCHSDIQSVHEEGEVIAVLIVKRNNGILPYGRDRTC